MLRLTKMLVSSAPLDLPHEGISIGACSVIDASESMPVTIGRGTKIGHSVIVSGGVSLGENVRLDSQSLVGSNTSIGAGSEIHGVKVHREVRIGRNSFIGGEVSNWTTIGDEVTFMGRIVHTYRKPGTAEDWRHSPPKPSPNISDRAVIGEGALLIGGIAIGARSYVAAGEVLKCSIPPDHIAVRGEVLPLSLFRGFIQSRS